MSRFRCRVRNARMALILHVKDLGNDLVTCKIRQNMKLFGENAGHAGLPLSSRRRRRGTRRFCRKTPCPGLSDSQLDVEGIRSHEIPLEPMNKQPSNISHRFLLIETAIK